MIIQEHVTCAFIIWYSFIPFIHILYELPFIYFFLLLFSIWFYFSEIVFKRYNTHVVNVSVFHIVNRMINALKFNVISPDRPTPASDGMLCFCSLFPILQIVIVFVFIHLHFSYKIWIEIFICAYNCFTGIGWLNEWNDFRLIVV